MNVEHSIIVELKKIREICRKSLTCDSCPFMDNELPCCSVTKSLQKVPALWNFRKLHGRMNRVAKGERLK